MTGVQTCALPISTEAGHWSLDCKSGALTGLAALARGGYDAVLVDERAGHHPGEDVLVAAHRAGLGIPMFLLAEDAGPDRAARARRAGAVDALPRDVGGLRLAEAVREAVRAARPAPSPPRPATPLPVTTEEVLAAARAGRLEVAFQPQVELQTGALTGVEALVRWAGPGKEHFHPARWVRSLEETGAVLELDLWMIEEAMRRFAQLGGRVGRLSVNVSAATLSNEQFLRRIDRLLPGLSGEVELELTETAFLEDPGGAANLLHVLRALGLRIALDDFGVGHSTLARLKDLPVDTLKVDRSFVQGITEGTRPAAIVEAIALIGARADLDVVAEGIEHTEQLERLRALGVGKGQGYLFSPPRRSSQLGRWLETYEAERRARTTAASATIVQPGA